MKAIVVFNEMPKTCEECKFSRHYGTFCDIQYCDTYRNETGRDENCPIKPLPDELESPYLFRQIQIASGLQNEDGSVPVYTEDYQKGWNDCLEEILGDYE